MDYLPVAATLAVGLVVSLGMIGLDLLLGPRRPSPVKRASYECGIPVPPDAARAGVHVRFFAVALLFLLFDVETVFLYPVAVHYRSLPFPAFAACALFVAALVVGYAYVWRKGGFEWE